MTPNKEALLSGALWLFLCVVSLAAVAMTENKLLLILSAGSLHILLTLGALAVVRAYKE